MKIQDINIEDRNLRELYYTNFRQGNYTECFRILQDNPQLKGKVSVAELYNTLSGSVTPVPRSLTALQKNYKDVEERMQSGVEEQDELIADFRFCGAWASGTHYYPMNCVSYDGFTYLSLNDFVSSTNPDQDSNWVEMNLKGMDGELALNIKIQYYWGLQRPYKANDLVYYNQTLWVAKQDHFSTGGNVPTEGSAYWWKFLETEDTKLIIQETAPLNPATGAIWLDIS